MRLAIKALRKRLKFTEIIILSVITLAVFLVLGFLNPNQFLRVDNFQSMAFQLPELGLLAMAMMVAMLTGGINLSIISSANLSGIITALLLQKLIPEGSTYSIVPFLIAIGAGLATVLLIGLINGLLIAVLDISPILATLGMMTLLEGMAIVLTKGYVISGFPKEIIYLGNGLILAVPVPFIIFIFCAVALAVILNRTRLGYSIYMLGSNATATRFSGINNTLVIIKTYMISGFYTGLAALIMLARFNSARSGYGKSYLLITVLAAVLGGTSTLGGAGRVSGLILALFILQIVSSGLNLLRVNTFLTTAIWGIIILIVMIINHISRRNDNLRS